MVDELDPRQTYWVTGSSEAMAVFVRKDRLLNELASWMVYQHEDEIAGFVASCEDIDFAAAVMADVIAQKAQFLRRDGGL